MPPDLEFTGERFVPGAPGEIAHEHRHRYAFARRYAPGRRVADIACGEGYGSALLADVAQSVTGVDIDAAAVAHAAATYARANLRFVAGSAAALPLPDASVDLVVSFETIEHLPRELQPAMLQEFARVLAPGGLLILSSPNRPEYSEARQYRNPFHLHELDRAELERLLDGGFPAQTWFRQRRWLGSALWAEEGADAFEAFAARDEGVDAARPPVAMYFVVVAARESATLPLRAPRLSLFTDADEREWTRLDAQAAEVLRLDALLLSRDQALDRNAGHVRHLEELVAFRDRLVAERDEALRARDELLRARDDAHRRREAELQAARAECSRAVDEAAALRAECARLEAAIAAQERIIAYRQSARWWVKLPWFRVRRLWHRLA